MILILTILVLFVLLLICNSDARDYACTEACEGAIAGGGCSYAVIGTFIALLVFLALSIRYWLKRLFLTERD